MQMSADAERAGWRAAIGGHVRTLAFAAGARPSGNGFGRMFPTLAAGTPADSRTLADLTHLAATMTEPDAPPPPPRARSAGDGDLPAAYTYLVRFVLNDLVWERPAREEPAAAAGWTPLGSLRDLENRRPGTLDLESIYDAPAIP